MRRSNSLAICSSVCMYAHFYFYLYIFLIFSFFFFCQTHTYGHVMKSMCVTKCMFDCEEEESVGSGWGWGVERYTVPHSEFLFRFGHVLANMKDIRLGQCQTT